MIIAQLSFLFLLVGFSKSYYCNLSKELLAEIRGYKTQVNQIIKELTEGKFKGKTYDELAKFVDKFGPRQAGGEVLEHSIDYLLDLMKSEGYELDNVKGEEVSVPHWVRGEESGEMLSPRKAKLPVLGLGGTVATPKEGIQANVAVFKSFEELSANPDRAKGKIVVFNNDFVSYGVSVKYRTKGPYRAALYGAVAVLVRSVTPFSLNTLHTGQTLYDNYYDGNVEKIPAASITVEHARMFQRYQDRNETITLKINLQSTTFNNSISRNTVAEVKGSTNPEKVVIVSGHLDSWDVGVGAMDDGGGAFISWYSLVVLKNLGLIPKRTVRAVLWTAEESGMSGVKQYDLAHKAELDNVIFIMESDEGTFTPLGLSYVSGQRGGCILEEVLKLLAPINASRAESSPDGVGSDITIWKDLIPTASLLNDNSKYFWYHHTEADTLDALNSTALDKATALWASVAYVIADLKDDFPRDFVYEAASGFQVTPLLFFMSLIVSLLSSCFNYF